MRLSFTLAALVLGLVGCASTQTTTIRNPEFASKAFGKVVVLGHFSDIAIRKRMEDGLVNSLARKGIRAVPSLSLFMPDASPEERMAAYRSAGADCVLAVAVTGVQQSEHLFSGPSSHTTASASCYGGSCQGSSTTQYTPAQTYVRPHMQFAARLTDIETAKAVWQSSAQSNGNGYANFETVERSFQEKTAEDLASEHFLVTASLGN